MNRVISVSDVSACYIKLSFGVKVFVVVFEGYIIGRLENDRSSADIERFNDGVYLTLKILIKPSGPLKDAPNPG